MNTGSRILCAAALLSLLGGCEHARHSLLPKGELAYRAINLPPEEVARDDLIRENDRLSIRVVGEPELTNDGYRVDSAGMIEVPLAGVIRAAGRTAEQVRDEIIARLASRYIRDPQVAVIVSERTKATYSVEGAVREPGTYEATGTTTLLGALASSKSPTNVARLDGVMIFRRINGQRMGARFNLVEIRNGRADDPQILPGDTVVVAHSDAKGAWREFLQAVPLFNLFYVFK